MQAKVHLVLLFVYFMHFSLLFVILSHTKSNKKKVFTKTLLYKNSFQNKR